jgi:hypothetical protein
MESRANHHIGILTKATADQERNFIRIVLPISIKQDQNISLRLDGVVEERRNRNPFAAVELMANYCGARP